MDSIKGLAAILFTALHEWIRMSPAAVWFIIHLIDTSWRVYLQKSPNFIKRK